MSADLVAFLKARLDEDEQIARAAQGDSVFDGTGIVIERNRAQGFPDRVAGLISPVATHISRHDPARVLREIEAKREIVRLHRSGPGWDGLITDARPHRDPVCIICADYDRNGDPTGDPYPCQTLRLLALPYAAHPGYRPEWAPDGEEQPDV